MTRHSGCLPSTLCCFSCSDSTWTRSSHQTMARGSVRASCARQATIDAAEERADEVLTPSLLMVLKQVKSSSWLRVIDLSRSRCLKTIMRRPQSSVSDSRPQMSTCASKTYKKFSLVASEPCVASMSRCTTVKSSLCLDTMVLERPQ